MRYRIRLGLGFCLILVGLYLAKRLGVPSCPQLKAQLEVGGVREVLGFALLYVAVAVLFLPASILAIAAGVVFGPLYGTVLVCFSSALGASVAFFTSRFLARDFIEKLLSRRAWYGRLCEGFKKNSFSYLVFLRLSPIFPYSGLNYAFGLLPVRFSQYLLSAVIGMLPGSLAYVCLGFSAGCSAGVSLPLILSLAALALLSLSPLFLLRR